LSQNYLKSADLTIHFLVGTCVHRENSGRKFSEIRGPDSFFDIQILQNSVAARESLLQEFNDAHPDQCLYGHTLKYLWHRSGLTMEYGLKGWRI